MRKLVTDRIQLVDFKEAQTGEEVYPIVIDGNGNVKVNPERQSSPFIVRQFDQGVVKVSSDLRLHSIIITAAYSGSTGSRIMKISLDGGQNSENHEVTEGETVINFGLSQVTNNGVVIAHENANVTFEARALLLAI